MIAIELLAQSIRHSDIIKGIKIQANQEVKLTQYADDTTALLADVQSVANLFELLTKFESCSGLKINQSKSEMFWLGSLSHQNDAICNLRLSHEPVYALRVHFSYNHETAVKDVRANCFCASLLCTQLHTPRHTRAGVLSNKMRNDRAKGHCYSFAWI